MDHRWLTDIRIDEVSVSYKHYIYRSPIKFGGVVLDKFTLLNVQCGCVTRDGKTAQGFGSMPLSNQWAFPTAKMPYDATLDTMTALAERARRICEEHGEFGHPLELGVTLEEKFLAAASEISVQRNLVESMPKLATLVTGSAFDAAVHDAFGKALVLNCYQTYGREFVSRDLANFLGGDYAGQSLDDYILGEPKERLPVYHLVGALDPLTGLDVDQPIEDGLPETLQEWITHSGVNHLKIKLDGDDLPWDLQRIMAVDTVASEVEQSTGTSGWQYSLDFNERCQHVDYLVDLLHRLKEQTPLAFDRVQYIEQPTARNLKANPQNRMHQAAKLKPVVIDESLTDLESLLYARELGYSGVALKACKGQTQSLLMAAAAQAMGLFLCVQDLGCPGASLIHSAGLAAHIPGVTAIEFNSRQYCPQANVGWTDRFPGVFQISDGWMDTRCLRGPGLSAVD